MTSVLQGVTLDDAIVQALEELGSEVELLRYSDKGANGHLFFADHKILDQKIAIKFYCWDKTRAHEEPRRLHGIRSDHVLEVLSARVVDEEWAMFQTPYCPRGDLDDVLASGPLSLHAAMDVTIEVLTGVSSLHGARVVHRDLKPGNVFMDGEGRALIGDFGSVKALPDGGDDVVGSGHSVLYRPPESFAHQRYGPPGDLYQCGLLLYQLLGGAFPYDPEAWLDREGQQCWVRATDDYDRSKCVDAAIARRALGARLLDLASLPGSVPRSLVRVISKATRPDPEGRYGGCGDFIAALRRVRGECFDWYWTGSEARVGLPKRRIRVSPKREKYVAQVERGNGWRKVKGVEEGDLEPVVREVEKLYG